MTDPVLVKPCGAWNCPQSPGCLRANRDSSYSYETRESRSRGCLMFIDVRGIALLTRPTTTAPMAQGA